MTATVGVGVALTESHDVKFSWSVPARNLVEVNNRYRWMTDEEVGARIWPTLEWREFPSSTATSPNSMLLTGEALNVLRGLAARPDLLAPASVRLVYLDPPFNTGRHFGDYADDLALPTWLTLMHTRIAATTPYLAPDASIWLHLPENMAHWGRLILDDIFGPESYVGSIAWQKRLTRESRSALSTNHDTILVCAPGGALAWATTRNTLSDHRPAGLNRDNDPRGPWRDAPFTAPGYRANQQYTIINPAGIELRPPQGRSWFATEATYNKLLADSRIWFSRGGAGQPRMKQFDQRKLVPFTIWPAAEVGANEHAARQLQSLAQQGVRPFATPKPEGLLERIIEIATDPGDTVLDPFAGSGTTAVVAQRMHRRWVAVERSRPTVQAVILPRLRAKVVEERVPIRDDGLDTLSAGNP